MSTPGTGLFQINVRQEVEPRSPRSPRRNPLNLAPFAFFVVRFGSGLDEYLDFEKALAAGISLIEGKSLLTYSETSLENEEQVSSPMVSSQRQKRGKQTFFQHGFRSTHTPFLRYYKPIFFRRIPLLNIGRLKENMWIWSCFHGYSSV